jgi:Fur family ferric uptake transcriptional regulator
MEIMDLLAKRGNEVNKTTVYRELDFLLSEQIIKNVQIDSSTEYYELADREHHHHLVCTNCKKILDFTPSDSAEKEMHALITDLEQKTGFQVDEHSFELFGRCERCRG